MIRVEPEAWAAMVAHARASYPNECCGAMLGATDGDTRIVRQAIALQNAFEGAQAARYELRPEDLLAADKAARASSLSSATAPKNISAKNSGPRNAPR